MLSFFETLARRHIQELITLNVEVTLDDFIKVNSFAMRAGIFLQTNNRSHLFRFQYLNEAGVHTDEKDMDDIVRRNQRREKPIKPTYLFFLPFLSCS